MLYLIRHAEAEGNALGQIMGQRDLPLTERGRRQAAALAGALRARGLTLTAVYASDLRRTMETAQPLAEACGAPAPLPRPGLRELGRGVLEGRGHVEAAELRRLPGVVESFEPEEAIVARIALIGAELRRAAAAADVAAVAHGGSLGRLLRLYLGLPVRIPTGPTLPGQAGPRFRLDNTGVTALAFAGGEVTVLFTNALDHLQGPDHPHGPAGRAPGPGGAEPATRPGTTDEAGAGAAGG